jgi:hypothetical protein
MATNPAPPVGPPVPPKFTFEGYPGTPFNIRGNGFGKETGQVTMSGQILPVTAWSFHRIKGVVPKSVQVGEIVVTMASGTVVGKIAKPTPSPSVRQI